MLIDYELVCNVLLNFIFSLDCACLCSAAWSEPNFMVVGVSTAITFLCVEWGLVPAWSRHKLTLPRMGGLQHPVLGSIHVRWASQLLLLPVWRVSRSLVS